MPYLECEKCGGYYKLKPGESANDFEKCQCGGNLKVVKSITQIKKVSNKKSSNKKRAQPGKDYSKEFSNLRKLINDVNKKINPLCIIIGLLVSVIVFIFASFIFGAMMIITGLSSILFYGAITLISVTFIGGIVTSFLGSHHLEGGIVNGTILSLIIIIAIGLIIGFVLFIVMGVVASIMANLSPLTSLGTTSGTSGSGGNPISSLTSLLNLLYGLIAIILIIIAGAGGGALGVIIKEKLNIPL